MFLLLPILLSFNAVLPLIPLSIIVILIAAGAGMTRGFSIFAFFGLDAMVGMTRGYGGGGAGKGLKGASYNRKAGSRSVVQGKARKVAKPLKARHKAKVDAKNKAKADAMKKQMGINREPNKNSKKELKKTTKEYNNFIKTSVSNQIGGRTLKKMMKEDMKNDAKANYRDNLKDLKEKGLISTIKKKSASRKEAIGELLTRDNLNNFRNPRSVAARLKSIEEAKNVEKWKIAHKGAMPNSPDQVALSDEQIKNINKAVKRSKILAAVPLLGATLFYGTASAKIMKNQEGFLKSTYGEDYQKTLKKTLKQLKKGTITEASIPANNPYNAYKQFDLENSTSSRALLNAVHKHQVGIGGSFDHSTKSAFEHEYDLIKVVGPAPIFSINPKSGENKNIDIIKPDGTEPNTEKEKDDSRLYGQTKVDIHTFQALTYKNGNIIQYVRTMPTVGTQYGPNEEASKENFNEFQNPTGVGTPGRFATKGEKQDYNEMIARTSGRFFVNTPGMQLTTEKTNENSVNYEKAVKNAITLGNLRSHRALTYASENPTRFTKLINKFNKDHNQINNPPPTI